MRLHQFAGLVTLPISLFLSAPTAATQSLLVVPNLTAGIDSAATMAVGRATYERRSLEAYNDSIARGTITDRTLARGRVGLVARRGGEAAFIRAAEAAGRAALTPGRFDPDFIGEMSPAVSRNFWGAAQSTILPSSTLGLGGGSTSLYTELGHVLSGSVRVAIGTTLSVNTEETKDSTNTTPTGFERFRSGGGNLSVTAVRPLILMNLGGYTRSALLLPLRVWANVPKLSSTEDVNDYGGEIAGSLLLQRQSNDSTPFLTLEVRGAWTVGTDAFYQTIGHSAGESFFYLAPSLALAVTDQVAFTASTFLAEGFGKPGIRLNLTLLKKKDEEKSQTAHSGAVASATGTAPPAPPAQ